MAVCIGGAGVRGGKKVSSQALGLMLIHTEDAYLKLIEGEPTAEKAWKKLEDDFEKRSNARMIQLRRKLTSLRLTKGKAIEEYLGEFRELKIDLEAARQIVSEASLFSLTRATNAEARVVLEGRTAQIETDGVVRMEAVKRGGLWEIETVGKQRAFLARGPVKGNRVCATAKRPAIAESVVEKTSGIGQMWEQQVEAVGAKEPEHGVEKTSPEKSDDGDNGGVWVTPKAKKTTRKRSVTS
ncbi:hypothetical protein KFL_011010020 [Klebsormidium nitens]|uniref:Uncharacterized protein n=1 Tax=Klebsormidium nitens TaxID=105231 RepID=A0A1Y1IVJ1_KLENI|nr:hypothetical protein KFL_011010020 [Klebsormidium nitens]|eukprot:GAQ92707.1 hypothetical protein KFL_011010020 [Klebsormidium nitens]